MLAIDPGEQAGKGVPGDQAAIRDGWGSKVMRQSGFRLIGFQLGQKS